MENVINALLLLFFLQENTLLFINKLSIQVKDIKSIGFIELFLFSHLLTPSLLSFSFSLSLSLSLFPCSFDFPLFYIFLFFSHSYFAT